jgi:hypothetical protein
MPTKTGYSLLGGGGKGYINIGGWNTTLTDKSTTQMEVPGVKRREGCNVYIYAKHGTQSAASAGLQVAISTPAVDGIGTLVPPLVFTAIAAGGANPQACKALTVGTCLTGMYGWYFVEGIASVNIATDTITVTLGEGICMSPASANKWIGCGLSAQGFALTAIACDVTGPAFLKLM